MQPCVCTAKRLHCAARLKTLQQMPTEQAQCIPKYSRWNYLIMLYNTRCACKHSIKNYIFSPNFVFLILHPLYLMHCIYWVAPYKEAIIILYLSLHLRWFGLIFRDGGSNRKGLVLLRAGTIDQHVLAITVPRRLCCYAGGEREEERVWASDNSIASSSTSLEVKSLARTENELYMQNCT